MLTITTIGPHQLSVNHFKLNNNLLGYYLRIYCSKIQIKRILSKIERKA